MERILHVVGGMGLGGTETFLMNIYRNINREKIQFDFVLYEGNKNNSFYENEIKKLGGKVFILSNPSIKNPFNAIFQIKKILKEYNYKAVHTHTKFNSGFSLFAAWLSKIKIRVAHSHNTGGGNRKTILDRVYQKIMFWMINIFATSYTACSKKAAEHLFTKNNIKSNYRFMPNAVDFNNFFNINPTDTIMLKTSLGIPKDSKVIGHVGRYGKAKNHIFIVNMFAELLRTDSHFYLILIGDGPSRFKIQKKVEELGISSNVKILGQRNDVPKLMNLMDVFILPSIYEGLGIVLLEAQTVGLPCIVSENIQPEADMCMGLLHWVNLNNIPGWITEIIKNKNSKIIDKNKIKNTLTQSPYVLSNVVNSFYDLYGLEELKLN